MISPCARAVKQYSAMWNCADLSPLSAERSCPAAGVVRRCPAPAAAHRCPEPGAAHLRRWVGGGDPAPAPSAALAPAILDAFAGAGNAR